jgi:protein-S-isoprenylcysteine O-methyltransferase Ste14
VKLNYITLVIVTVVVAFMVEHFWGQPWTAQRIAALAVAIPCCILVGIARVQLGRAFSVRAKATILVTNGIYSRIRNPIYVFGSPAIMGLAIWGNMPSILPIFLLVIPLQIYRAHTESKVLEQHFGAAYRDYKRQTWF